MPTISFDWFAGVAAGAAILAAILMAIDTLRGPRA